MQEIKGLYRISVLAPESESWYIIRITSLASSVSFDKGYDHWELDLIRNWIDCGRTKANF